MFLIFLNLTFFPVNHVFCPYIYIYLFIYIHDNKMLNKLLSPQIILDNWM